jgi:DNA-binding winged helix-turn-helix (wHTH) protein/TolB-like protein
MSPDQAPIAIDLAHEPPFRLGGLEVRPATRELVAGEARQVLEPRIMQVLVALARRRGEVVSRDDLIAECWGGRVVGDDSIDRCISAIRRLAETHGGFSVETIVRVGYRLKEGEARRSGGLWPKPRAGRWAWAAAVLAVVIAAASGLWLLRDRILPPPKAQDVRVAILPFDTLGSGPEARAFADSLREEILGVLAKNQVLVVSRDQSAGLRGPGNSQAIERLGVRLMLGGAVQQSGSTLRVRVRLEDARSHLTMWSRDFEGPAQDADFLQTRVAGHITNVTTWMTSDRYGIGSRIDLPTLAAYAEGGDEIETGGDRGVAIFRQVVARAPDFSYGHSGLASALFLSIDSAPTAQRAQMRAEVRREADRALSLDPHNGEGYVALAGLTPLSGWREREALIKKGLSVDPGSPYLASLYGTLLADVGRGEEALAMQQRAVAADPYWPRGHANLAKRLVDQGRVEEGLAAIERAARLWPDDPFVNETHLRLALETADDRDAAFSELDRLFANRAADATYGWDGATSILFAPAASSVRMDPRFTSLAARLGLVAYWRTTGKWPDFCHEPHAPPVCDPR